MLATVLARDVFIKRSRLQRNARARAQSYCRLTPLNLPFRPKLHRYHDNVGLNSILNAIKTTNPGYSVYNYHQTLSAHFARAPSD